MLIMTACTNSSQDVGQTQISKEEMKKRAEEMMKAMMPGEEHQFLKSLVGTWKYHSKLIGNSGKSFYSATGKTTNELILDGRFLLSESIKSDSLTLPIGVFVLGFDRGQKKYTTTIFSEGGTNYVTTIGIMDLTTKQIITSGGHFNPILKVDENYDVILSMIDSSSYSIEIIFKDKLAKSTASGLRIDYLREE